MKQRPWYLRDKFLYAICFIVPVIGYLIVLCNKKKFEHKEWMPFLVIATITTSVWVLKFLPIYLFIAGMFLLYLFIDQIGKN